jgi:hypothetical protein
VAKNEALYYALDVTYVSEYRHATAPWVDRPWGGGLVLHQGEEVRVVRQHGLHRVVSTERTRNGLGPPDVRVFGTAFDGETTRTRNRDSTDAKPGRSRLPREAYFPHMWATGPYFETFPLSVFVGGGPAWDAFPGRHPGFSDRELTTTVYDGASEVNGEPCVVARCRLADKVRPGTVYLYWLAVGKNYLPLRVKKFSGPYSEALPIEVVEADDLRQVRPGVWVPYRMTRTVYDSTELRVNRRLVVSNTTTSSVRRLSPVADIPLAFFRDLRVDGE